MIESTSRRPAYVRLLDRAVRILTMCDHSEQKLRRRLTVPIMGRNDSEEIDAAAEDYERATAWCHEHGYLSDSRFVTRFIASRSRKGYGPVRIRRELSQKGISREAIEKVVCECDIDWCALVRDQATRRYSELLPTVLLEKAKIQRFLLYCGYLIEDIQEVWRNFAD